MLNITRIHSYELGLLQKHGEFSALLSPGKYMTWAFSGKRIKVADMRFAWNSDPQLEEIARTGRLDEVAEVLEVPDGQRGLVWIDGHFNRIVEPGLHVFWNRIRSVRTELVSLDSIEFKHKELETILGDPSAEGHFLKVVVEDGQAGILRVNGSWVRTLTAGRYVFWRAVRGVEVILQELREQVLDVSGQEIITSDKVSLRLNTLATYRIEDPLKAVLQSADAAQSLYREIQLALREAVGVRSLEQLLADKQEVAKEILSRVAEKAGLVGIRLLSLGIRDIILPGDMKNLMNQVIEAQKNAEANQIIRREEVAAMRSQVNTARLLEGNPGLIRMKELEILEKLVSNPNLKVVLGEKGISERISTLL